jgi:hypothetical protein
MKGNIKNIIDNFFVIDESSTNTTNVSQTRRALVSASRDDKTVLNAVNLSSD